ncbi:MAG: ImmA/IrrE family metallo-endopeptidase [Fimbriimonadaceae bacterium]|nr:ImmA/IrrE family metallo-endopeptidase [Fimbriimonadaceae bacterium]
MAELLKPCNRPKAEVERLAASIRERIEAKLGFKDGDDLRSVVHRLGGTIEYRSAMDWDADDGSIEVRGRNDFVIRLPQETTVTRDRFTIAHELGHYFLHANQGERTGKAARSGMDERVEWEANWFAGELLMPRAAYAEAYKEHGGDLKPVAARFGVSVDAARVRRDVLGLDCGAAGAGERGVAARRLAVEPATVDERGLGRLDGAQTA